MNKKRWLGLVFWLVVVGSAVVFRLYDLEKRTFWNVDQSLTMWQIKKVAVDHQVGLIGLHFFSLVDGAIYRTPFYNWLMAIPAVAFGLKAKVMSIIYALISLLSLYLVVRTAEKLRPGLGGGLTGLVYALSWQLARTEMMIRPVILLIITSSFLLWWLTAKKKKVRGEDLITGLVLGFGFSLHLSVMFLILGVVVYLIFAEGRGVWRRLVWMTIGVVVMLSPLIVFNFRHDFILNKGIVRMATGKAVDEGQASLRQRVEIATNTISCQAGNLAGMGCVGFGWLLVAVGLGFATLRLQEGTKNVALYCVIQMVTAMVGVGVSGRLGYSSELYIIYLMPVMVVLFALVVERLLISKAWWLGAVMMVVFLKTNFEAFAVYSDTNAYYHKKKLAEFIYSQETDGRIGVKFWDQETLAYDFVFWEVAREMGWPYEKVNLIELWGNDEAEMVVYLNKRPDGEKGAEYKFGDSKLIVF